MRCICTTYPILAHSNHLLTDPSGGWSSQSSTSLGRLREGASISSCFTWSPSLTWLAAAAAVALVDVPRPGPAERTAGFTSGFSFLASIRSRVSATNLLCIFPSPGARPFWLCLPAFRDRTRAAAKQRAILVPRMNDCAGPLFSAGTIVTVPGVPLSAWGSRSAWEEARATCTQRGA